MRSPIPLLAFAALVNAAAVCAPLAAWADEQSAHDLYLKAIAAMNDLPQPRYVSYRLVSTTSGLKAELSDSCTPCLTPGNNAGDRWTIRHNTSDYASEIGNDADGKRYLSSSPNLDPTWYGAYRALRIGMIHQIGAYSVPRPSVTPGPIQATPTPDPSQALKTISLVAVIGPAIYNVEDRGAAICSNGDPGRALHLWSRERNPRHQLSDVVIDLKSSLFCMVRMAANGPGPLGGNAIWEEHFGQVGPYWMVTDGSVEGMVRVLGISAAHGIWRFRTEDMTFPASFPAQTFSMKNVE